MIEVILQPRAGVGELIEQHLDGKIPYSGSPDSLCAKVYALGYNCNSLYEMVIAAERVREEE
jgi:hypothetical protein